MKDDLGRKTVESDAGGGLVRCVVSGAGEVLSLEIDPSLARLDTPGNTKLLADLVLGAVNVGLERARELARAELAKVTGGLPLPPGMFGDG